jgi:hypothetical protein
LFVGTCKIVNFVKECVGRKTTNLVEIYGGAGVPLKKYKLGSTSTIDLLSFGKSYDEF